MRTAVLFPTVLVLALSLSACQGKRADSLFDPAILAELEEEGSSLPVAVPQPGGQAGTDSTGVKLVQYSKSIKSTSRSVAIEQFMQGNFYESIVSEVEGYRANLYNDNIGFAIGNGWNVSLQTAQTNRKVSQGIGLDGGETRALVELAGNMQPTSLPRLSITAAQATKAAQLMRPQFEEPIRRLVGEAAYDSLKEHQKAALTYHVYKVGPGGAAKYKNLLSNVRLYAANPTQANALKVGAGFTYKYKLNGQVMQDTRSTIYLSSLFIDPEAYAYLLGTKPAPADFKSIAKLSKQTIDPSKSADSQIKDDFGLLKEKLLEQGQLPQIEVQEEISTIDYLKSIGKA